MPPSFFGIACRPRLAKPKKSAVSLVCIFTNCGGGRPGPRLRPRPQWVSMNEGTLASKASYNWTRGAAANSGREVWGVDHQSAVSAVRSLRFGRVSSTERGTTGFDTSCFLSSSSHSGSPVIGTGTLSPSVGRSRELVCGTTMLGFFDVR